MTGPVPPGEPLRLTTARWYNKRETAEKWGKAWANRGPVTQYLYGTDTPARYPHSDHQRCFVFASHTYAIGIDVDNEAEYMTTALARLVNRQHAISTRGPDRYHAIIDARGVPAIAWPRPGAIVGANSQHAGDIKSNGFVPVPGCWHYSGVRYEPVTRPGGGLHAVPCTPEILAAIQAARPPRGQGNGHGGGGTGGGHDGEVAAHVLGWVRQAVNAARDPASPAVREAIYARWLQVAVSLDPAWPYDRADFDRHYGDETRGAVAKARAEAAQEREWWARWGPGLYRWALKWTEGQDYATYRAWQRRSA